MEFLGNMESQVKNVCQEKKCFRLIHVITGGGYKRLLSIVGVVNGILET